MLSTLAASLSVALDNARLFDETTHLLAETEQRNAELAVINEIGEALAKQLDFEAIIEAVGERIHGIFDVTTGGISLYDPDTNTLSMPYSIDQGQRQHPQVRQLGGLAKVVIETRRPLRLASNLEAEQYSPFVFGTDDSEAWLGVPILAGTRVLGTISLERLPKNAFSELDERLLATIASSLGVALENARLFDETKRLLVETNERAAELAIINSVQEGLAAKLDMQAMYDLVGDKITEIFDVDGVDIERYDATTGIVTFEYTVERGERLPADPISLIGFRRQVVQSRAPVLINRDLPARAVEAGQPATIAGELAKSALFVPMITGGAVTGIVLIENLEHEDAFSERDVRLLTTIAGSLGVALENARLFDETQRLLNETNERAAELAIINSVQQGLAEKIDMQQMYDLVGDKIREIFDAQVVDIGLYDVEAGQIVYPYSIERGVRSTDEVGPITGFGQIVLDTRAPVMVNDIEAYYVQRGQTAPGAVFGEPAKSVLFVPLIVGETVNGRISLQNLDRENAFADSDLRLLVTIASSLSVALENARLFAETQRLLIETNERAAELAIINSVQEGLAARLDMQAMYELVGDKIQEIFDAQIVDIALQDPDSGLMRFRYGYERGERFGEMELPLVGFRKQAMEKREPVVVNERMMERAQESGHLSVAYVGETPRSGVWVPLLAGGKAIGVVSLQNLDRENAFSPANIRLLSTLAGSLAVALEGARLFDETKRLLTETNARAAELAIINSVQQGLASKLDMESMYDLLGDKVREIFDAQGVDIAMFDTSDGLIHFEYEIERGVRLHSDPIPLVGFRRQVFDSKAPLVLNRDVERLAKESGQPYVISGEPTMSAVFVPLMAGGKVKGAVSLQNVDREDAFSDADVRLLTTLASSLSVALENARLFDETQRLLKETNERAAELAIINSVQQGLAAKLEMQSMYDLVGDKIREIFDAQVVDIALLSPDKQALTFAYSIERGVREPSALTLSLPFGPLSNAVINSGAPLLVNDVDAWEREHRVEQRVVSGEPAKSVLFVPMLVGDDVRGYVSLQNVDRTDVFTEADQRLLGTLTSSLSVALENARLFDETQRLLDRDQRAGGRTGDHQQRPAGSRVQAGHAVDV